MKKIGKIDNAIKEYKTAAEYDYAKSQYASTNIYYEVKRNIVKQNGILEHIKWNNRCGN